MVSFRSTSARQKALRAISSSAPNHGLLPCSILRASPTRRRKYRCQRGRRSQLSNTPPTRPQIPTCLTVVPLGFSVTLVMPSFLSRSTLGLIDHRLDRVDGFLHLILALALEALTALGNSRAQMTTPFCGRRIARFGHIDGWIRYVTSGRSDTDRPTLRECRGTSCRASDVRGDRHPLGCETA
jgi:hypothetical protein